MICPDPDIYYGAADWPRDTDDPDFDPFADEHIPEDYPEPDPRMLQYWGLD